jgi:hypothetical protein
MMTEKPRCQRSHCSRVAAQAKRGCSNGMGSIAVSAAGDSAWGWDPQTGGLQRGEGREMCWVALGNALGVEAGG